MAFNFFKNDFGWVRGQSGNSKRLSETQGRRAPAKKVPPASLAEAMILDTEAAVMANFDFLAQVLSVFFKNIFISFLFSFITCHFSFTTSFALDWFTTRPRNWWIVTPVWGHGPLH